MGMGRVSRAGGKAAFLGRGRPSLPTCSSPASRREKIESVPMIGCCLYGFEPNDYYILLSINYSPFIFKDML